MADKSYIERIKQVIFRRHQTDAQWARTVPVREFYQGKLIWEGEVEIFRISGHPKAKRCFAWLDKDGKEDSDEHFATVLEIPPVNGPHSAVQVSVASEVGEGPKE